MRAQLGAVKDRAPGQGGPAASPHRQVAPSGRWGLTETLKSWTPSPLHKCPLGAGRWQEALRPLRCVGAQGVCPYSSPAAPPAGASALRSPLSPRAADSAGSPPPAPGHVLLASAGRTPRSGEATEARPCPHSPRSPATPPSETATHSEKNIPQRVEKGLSAQGGPSLVPLRPGRRVRGPGAASTSRPLLRSSHAGAE